MLLVWISSDEAVITSNTDSDTVVKYYLFLACAILTSGPIKSSV